MENQANPSWQPGGPDMFSGTARRRATDRPFLIDASNAAQPSSASPSLSAIFEEVVHSNPLAVALSFRGIDLNYDQLNRKANRLAHRLRRLGVGPESLVGISLERSMEFIISVLAVIKAGGAYVPLDLSYPPERINFMLRDTHPEILLTGAGQLATYAPWARRIAVTAELFASPSENEENLEGAAGAHNAAYVMYTSGSTGNPKGVVIEQRSIVRLVQEPNYISICPRDTFLQLAPVSFDASTLEIWGALLNGARLVIMEPGSPSLKEIGHTIEQEQVTTLWLTAGLFHAMVDEQLCMLGTVRNLLAGGDVLSPTHVAKFLEMHPSSVLINGYGPTEGTTFTCCHPMRHGDPIGKTVPIGRPISKTRVLILDDKLNQVSIGEPGELYIGGEGVARGYLNQPQLTAERFVTNPYSSDKTDVLYRSGDLVSIRADGAIEFLGRKDGQVKIRGYRVELGEIEVALQQNPAVRHVVAIAIENGIADKTIHAFWTARAGAVAETEELLTFAAEHLPAYMVPASLTRLDSLPLTENGKVDRKLLMATAVRDLSRQTNYAPPSDTLEVQLIEIWEEILGATRVGVRDDFFKLGGHSLMAARMFARIEQELHKTLPLATMFQAPTIEKLAEIIRAEGWTPDWSSLVPIQQGGNKPPLFLVHGIMGNVLSFYGLRHHIAAEQPVYGIQAEGLGSNRGMTTTIPEMAANYIRDIRTVQPAGPYFLGGFSAGGLVAYEMAQQLTAAGERVDFLALFDSFVEVAGGYWLKSLYSRRALRMSIRALRASLHTAQKDGLAPVVKKKFINMGVNLRIMGWNLVRKLTPKKKPDQPMQALSFLNVTEAFTRAIRVYQPKPYSGSATLFRSPSSDFDTPDASDGWGPYIAGTLELHQIDGDHNTIFREPHIGRLADQLMQTLESAQSREAALAAK